MKKKYFLIVFMIVFMLSACSSPAVQPAAVNLSTPTQPPANIPISTSTQSPTPKLEPTATLTPTPTIEPPVKVNTVLDGVQVTLYDSLGKTPLKGWNLGRGALSTDGAIKLTGTTSWSSSFERQNKFQEGSGFTFSYKYSPQPEFEIFFDVGQWAKPEYRRFGVYPNGPSANLFQGANGLGFNRLASNFSLTPNTWYSILMAIGKDGDFLALIWDKDKPERTARYREVIKKWGGNSWRMAIGANKGTIEFKDYMEITFTGYKK